MKTAEEIVRALAEDGPPSDADGFRCGFQGCHIELTGENKHDADCPYRMAVEWVKRQDEHPDCAACQKNPHGDIVKCRAHSSVSDEMASWESMRQIARSMPNPPVAGRVAEVLLDGSVKIEID